ncbi:MAG: type II toxin-antitoxin system HicB family antitoxin [Candidatus Paceibacterota bacterium]|jgi:predicted RNase H-like HicB family nuclease
MKPYTYRVIIEKDGKYFHGSVPALSGCHTFGKTIEETRKNLREAIELYLEVLREEKSKIPEDTGIESFETVFIPFRKSYV